MKKGDLVHIPQGTLLHVIEDEETSMYTKEILITKEPNVGIYIGQKTNWSMHQLLFNNQLYYANNNSIYEMKRNNKDDNKIS
jgi:hypothetical protein